MNDFRIGYLYSLSPIHCGGEGDLGNILEIAREVHTNFPYIPGSSLRGSLRDEVKMQNEEAANALFGKELNGDGQMGVHQVWFGDARLLWIPMRTMSNASKNVFTWISCHSLIRDRALIARIPGVTFPEQPVGSQAGNYTVADAKLTVSLADEMQTNLVDSIGHWPDSLKNSVKPNLQKSWIVLPDSDFQVLMEHSLWTQVRNKIQEEAKGANQAGSAEVFWTDVCIPRDTILYYPWGYSLLAASPVNAEQCRILTDIMQGLIQIGGQANVGRGWVQSWVSSSAPPNGVQSSGTSDSQPNELISEEKING